MANGGYEEGYTGCPCFWGREPGSLLSSLFTVVPTMHGWHALDAGCGEGKNAHAMAVRGAHVIALDCSERAISNGRVAFSDRGIEWCCGDIQDYPLKGNFDIVVAYGLLHCLPSQAAVAAVVERLKSLTGAGGYLVVCAFNSRSHDLSAHPGFTPCLLDHLQYVKFFDGWHMLTATDTDLQETHPHNLVPHHHSMTRIMARRPM